MSRWYHGDVTAISRRCRGDVTASWRRHGHITRVSRRWHGTVGTSRRCHHGDIITEISSRRYHHGGIITEISSRRYHHGDIITEISSRRYRGGSPAFHMCTRDRLPCSPSATPNVHATDLCPFAVTAASRFVSRRCHGGAPRRPAGQAVRVRGGPLAPREGARW